MRSKILSGIGALVAAGGLLYAGVSCLKLDRDRSCSREGSPCYQGEVCFEGRCYDKGNVPERADTSERMDADTAGDTVADTEPSPDTAPETGPEDTAPVDTTQDTKPVDSASDTVRDTRYTDGGDTSYGDLGGPNSYCRQLLNQHGSLGGLRNVWNRSADAGTQPRNPGASCSTQSDCEGACENGTCVHRIFVTSMEYEPDFGSLRQADCACQLAAQNSTVSDVKDGTYQTLLSSGTTSAAERIDIRADVYVNEYSGGWSGNQKFSNSTFPWGTFSKNAPSYTENGNELTGAGNFPVWMAWENETTADDDKDCDDWTSRSSGLKGSTGSAVQTTGWYSSTSTGFISCDSTARIYCIEQ